jgi:hypothetical protein
MDKSSNGFMESSEVEIKKIQISLSVEYIPCKKCGTPLELNAYIGPHEDNSYYQKYACLKCEESYVIKSDPIDEITYPRVYSDKLRKEIWCAFNHSIKEVSSIMNFLWEYIRND